MTSLTTKVRKLPMCAAASDGRTAVVEADDAVGVRRSYRFETAVKGFEKL